MTYKDWLYTLILDGNGSSSGSGKDSGSNEPLIVQIIKKSDFPAESSRFPSSVKLILNRPGEEIYDALMEGKQIICIYNNINNEEFICYVISCQKYMVNEKDTFSFKLSSDKLFDAGATIQLSDFSTNYDALNEYPVMIDMK